MGEAELRKAELGELALYFWWNLGKPKTPEEVLRSDIARAVIEMRRLRVSL